MLRSISCTLLPAMLAASLAVVPAAYAQSSDQPGLLDRIFGRDAPGAASERVAQVSASDLVVRLERLENQIRQLTGAVEQLQFRNQQLEQQVRRMQEDVDFRFQERGEGRARPLPPRAASAPADPGPATATAIVPRRPDVFDPNENPNAPGAPRPLGSIPEPAAGVAGQTAARGDEAPGVGVPGGRPPGAPLDLSTLSDRAAVDPTFTGPSGAPSDSGTLPPPRNPGAPGAQHAMLPPNATPKDEFDLAYGYLLRKDYALAESSFRDFLRKYPNERQVAEAHYWLGESLFQRQRYRDAAESFLTVSTKFDKSPKAPEALLRLGQSLASLQEREAACATYNEVARKFPNSSAQLKQAVDREKKRSRCS